MSFRRFVAKDVLNEKRHYMALNSSHPTPFDLPIPVMNVLNSVRKGDRVHVLHWLMTEGMRKSQLARKQLADQFEKQYGIKIGQDGLFNKRAYQELGVSPEQQKQLLQSWFSNKDSEPDFIPVADRRSDVDNRNGYNLSAINAALEAHGKTPLHFGGPDGLIEYIEDGKWRQGDDRYRFVHDDSRYGKQGHDLSLDKDDVYALLHGDDPQYQYRSGTSQYGGFNLPNKADQWRRWIFESEHASSKKLKQIVQDLKAGKQVTDPDLDFLNQLVKNGEVDKDFVKEIKIAAGKEAGMHNRKVSAENPYHQWSDEDAYMAAKAAMRAYIELMFELPPNSKLADNEAGFVAGDGKTSRSLAPDHNTPIRFNAAGKSIYNVNNMPRQQAVDQMMKLIFPDDEKMQVLDSFALYSKNGKNRVPVDNAVASKRDDAQVRIALRQFQKQRRSIPVDIKGQKTDFDPSTVLDTLTLDRESHRTSALQAPDYVAGGTEPVDLDNLKKQGYVVKGDPKTDDNLTLELPGTKNTKDLIKRQGVWHEKLPAHEQQITPPDDWKIEPVGKSGNYFKFSPPEGEEGKPKLVRRVEKDGQFKYYALPDVPSGTVDDPLISGLKITPNKGMAGQKNDMSIDRSKLKSRWDDYLKNWQDYGERGAPNSRGLPHSVHTSIGRGFNDKFKGHEDDLEQEAQLALMQQLGNKSFRYGDPVGSKEKYLKELSAEYINPQELAQKGYSLEDMGDVVKLTPVSKDIVDKKPIIARKVTVDGETKWSKDKPTQLSPEEAQKTINAIKDYVFDAHGPHLQPKSFSGPELFKADPEKKTIYFRDDIFKSMISMGYRFRKNIATSTATARYNQYVKNTRKEKSGQGGSSDDDDYDAMAQAADRGDWDSYARMQQRDAEADADDYASVADLVDDEGEEELIRKHSDEKESDPDTAGLSAIKEPERHLNIGGGDIRKNIGNVKSILNMSRPTKFNLGQVNDPLRDRVSAAPARVAPITATAPAPARSKAKKVPAPAVPVTNLANQGTLSWKDEEEAPAPPKPVAASTLWDL